MQYRWGLLIEGTPRIKELRVQDVGELSFDAPSRLEILGLQFSDVSAADFSKIVAAAPLVEVELNGGRSTDLGAALQELQKVSSLRKLVILQADLTESDVTRIGSLRQLDQLDISYNEKVGDDSLRQLDGLANLRSLRLVGTNVSRSGVKRIESAVPGLRCSTMPPPHSPPATAGRGGPGPAGPNAMFE
jgi:hypothetical protein